MIKMLCISFMRIGGNVPRLFTKSKSLVMVITILCFYCAPVYAQTTLFAWGTATDITPQVNNFKTMVGGGNIAGANGSFGALRREINWDGVPNQFASPNNLPANFFNVNSPRGVVFSTPGTGFQVSANAGVAPVEFGNIDPSYPNLFAPFSAQRLFTPLGSNVTDVNFFVPGTNTPALVKAFGVVFSDQNAAGTIMYLYDKDGNQLTSLSGTSTQAAASESFSFFGFVYNDPTVARVRIVSGTAALGATENLPATDLVVMDDFIYSEPVAFCTPPTFLNTLPIVGHASCGVDDGQLVFIPTSGTAPYMYSIDGGANYVSGPDVGYTFFYLAPGNYQMKMKDANGCESDVVNKTIEVRYGLPNILNTLPIVGHATCGISDGQISVIPTCGTAPFLYSIDGGTTYVSGPNVGFTFFYLPAGTYQLRIKAADGNESVPITREINEINCPQPTVATNSIQKNATSKLNAENEHFGISAFPNPGRGIFKVNLNSYNATRGEILVYDSKGVLVKKAARNNTYNKIVDVDLTGRAPGVYYIKWMSDKGGATTKIVVR